MRDFHIVSFSGGKDSTAMLLMMVEKGMQIDEILFCDTGMEFPEMADHVKKVEEYIGREITVIKHDKGFEHLAFERVLTKGKREGEKGYGWPRPNARWCTSRLKTELIGKHLRNRAKEYNVIQYVGIAADEERRVKDKVYPLVEWGVTEAEALQYCYDRGFDWGGLYEIFGRVSCWCCPLKSLAELKNLRKHRPELWQRLREMDEKSYNTFKINCSVEQLEERFAKEEE